MVRVRVCISLSLRHTLKQQQQQQPPRRIRTHKQPARSTRKLPDLYFKYTGGTRHFLFNDVNDGIGCDALDEFGNVVDASSADHCCQGETYCCPVGKKLQLNPWIEGNDNKFSA